MTRERTDLLPGDPAPWFAGRAPGNDNFQFHTLAGRYVVLVFVASAGGSETRRILDDLWRRTDVFDGERAAAVAVTADPEDESLGRIVKRRPGHTVIWDSNGAVHRLFGIGAETVAIVLDPTLRALDVKALRPVPEDIEGLLRFVAGLPSLDPTAPSRSPAPILLVPRVFELEFCRELIDLYERHGGTDSGFMRTDPKTGQTVGVVDYSHKRRRDHVIEDAAVRAEIRARIQRRLIPEIERAFQFKATFVERYVVACYDAEEGGYFRPHRDNTTKGTEHRRFAVTVNLNAEDYEGGDLRFPEYGRGTHRAPTGGAVVFSCSLLHEATPVTRGRRYCMLPFLYDDAAAVVRDRNLEFVADPALRAPSRTLNRAQRRRLGRAQRKSG